MTISQDEICTLALRYVDESEIVDFPLPNETFCIFKRNTAIDMSQKDDEGWEFSTYAICTGYDYDYEEKPLGKWILFSYLTLDSFPPQLNEMRLQPPHIAKGLFNNSDRSMQIKIITIRIDVEIKLNTEDASGEQENNLINFPTPNK